MNDLICWHNGKYVKLGEVSISILDFGFIHSDATYDVMKTSDNNIMFYEMHYSRYINSCKYFGFSPIKNIKQIVKDLLDKNQIKDAFVWICNWKGTPLSGSPRDMTGPEHQIIYIKPYYKISDNPVSVCIHTENRRTPDSVVLQKYKNFGWIELTKAQKFATQRGYDTAIVLTVDDFIAEGPGFSICYVKGNSVFTPKKDVLESVTVDIVENICKKLNFNFVRTNIQINDISLADEVFICSTSGGITPVYKFEDTIYHKSAVTTLFRETYDMST